MLECLVNSVPATPIPGLQTWRESLAGLDGRLAQDRRMMTAARYGGVDQPSCRSMFLHDSRVWLPAYRAPAGAVA